MKLDGNSSEPVLGPPADLTGERRPHPMKANIQYSFDREADILYLSKGDPYPEVESEEIVGNLSPDMTPLKKIPARGVIVTSRSSSKEFDFVSRYFGPASGVDEDPVTGSAYCCLGTYWQKKLNKSVMLAFQASKRGGVVRVAAMGDRTLIGGQAVIVLKGELMY